MKTKNLSAVRGSSLVAVVIFGAIISVSAAFAYRSTIHQSRSAYRSQDYLTALNVAEAGAELAMVELNKSDSPFLGWSGVDPRSYTHTVRDHNNEPVGEVRVSVQSIGSDPRVIATGYVPNKASARLARTVQLSTKSNTAGSPWGKFGLFSFGDLNFEGFEEIKSFDPSNPNANTGKATVGALGNISFKGTQYIYGSVQAGGDISFDNNSAKVYGDVFYGGSLNTRPHNYPTIFGQARKTSLRTPDRTEPPPKPARPTSDHNARVKIRPRNGGGKTQDGIQSGAHLSISNSIVTLPAPGVYRLASFKNNNNSMLEIVGTGDVTLYIDGDFDLSAIETTTIKRATNGQSGPNVTLVAKEAKFNNYGTVEIQNDSKLSLFAEALTGNGSKAVLMDHTAKMTISVDKLHFSGAAAFNTGRWNPTPGPASNLQIFAKDEVRFTNGAAVSGILYAPDAYTLFSGGFNWWGAVIGGDIDIKGGPGVRIDESLLTAQDGSGASVSSWTEISPAVEL